MKKLFLTTALSVAATMSAQIDFSATRFGITAGPTYSRVQNAHNPSGSRVSVMAGVQALTPVGSDDQFYIQTEVLYLGAGEGGDRKIEKNRNVSHAVYGNNYISVPISFKGYFSEDENEFFALVGPRFNFLIGQTIKNPAKESYKVDTYGKANSFNFGAGAGFGYSYKRQLELVLKYDIHLSNAYPNLKNSPEEIRTMDPSVARKKTEHVISVGLSYFFE
ncbi:porin family protein [Chryseobacterium sp. T1]